MGGHTTTVGENRGTVADIPAGPFDVEFFFDPGCPFAWQASVWIRRVAELDALAVGWRFISLRMLNEGKDQPPQLAETQVRTHGYLRLCAAARDRFGNDVVGALYRSWGERYWYGDAEGGLPDRLATGARRVDPVEIVRSLDLPLDLVDAVDDATYDGTIRAETEEALRRTGRDVGTPIITYDPPHGNSLFGPVLSEVPDDERAVELFHALRTIASFRAFSELKRSNRSPLDLPLLAS